MANEEHMLTVAAAAAELGIAVTSLYRYIKKFGLTTYRRIGDKRSYLKAAELEKLRGFMPREKAD